MPRLHKATLLGIAAAGGPPAPKRSDAVAAAPIYGGAANSVPSSSVPSSSVPSSASSAPPEVVSSDYPEAGPGATGGFRVSRFSDSERPRKATLLGAAISVPPPAPLPAASKATTPSRGLSTGTLLGVANPLDVRVSRLSGSSTDATGDVRTIIGMPMTGATIRDGRDGIGLGATQADMQNAGPKGERIASTWQEDAGSERPSLPSEPVPEPSPVPGPRVGSGSQSRSSGDSQSRSAAGAHFEARRPKRSFPLQYLGIVMLTCAAYFAWLYLLDHW
jgi:hypothetical protein